MENRKKYYLVSFGDSKKYVLETEAPSVSAVKQCGCFTKKVDEVRDYLKQEFPGESVKYFDTPDVKEIAPEELEKYAGYPMFDKTAVEEIKSAMAHGIKVRDADCMNNANARFDHLDKDAL